MAPIRVSWSVDWGSAKLTNLKAIIAGIVQNGLVLYLDASNPISYPGSGTTWYDLTTPQENGTLINSPTFLDGALIFDGINDYVQLGNVYNNGTSDISTEFWFNASSWAADKILLTNKNALGANRFFISLSTAGGNKLLVRTQDSTVGASYLTSQTFLLNTWYHIVFTRKGGVNKLYVNNVLDINATNTVVGDIGNVEWLAMGRPSTAGYVNGKMSELRIYNTELTSENVEQNFNETKNKYGL